MPTSAVEPKWGLPFQTRYATDPPDYSKRYETDPGNGKMIYLATYKKKHDSRQPEYKQRKLLFIEADEGLGLDKVVTLVRRIAGGDFDASSVEIIARKDWDAANIRHPRIRIHKLH